MAKMKLNTQDSTNNMQQTNLLIDHISNISEIKKDTIFTADENEASLIAGLGEDIQPVNVENQVTEQMEGLIKQLEGEKHVN